MKAILNDYRLKNANERLSPDEIRSSLAHFEYFMSNYQQIVNKSRQLVPFKLNAFQRKLFEVILPLVHKDTRINKRHTVLVVKGRQVGCSVGVTALINYLCAFADLQNISVAHVFPVGDTITKFYHQKVLPIIQGVHSDLFPNVERETLSSSILTHYKDIKNKVPLNNYYELISSGSSSIRSSTLQILLEDEVGFYKNPQQLEDAVLPALPDIGFSLVVYLSTVSDTQASLFFLDKLRIAMANPEDYTVIFVPWFFTYPEVPLGADFDSLILDDYESEHLVPNFIAQKLPRDKWGDCIVWYRKRLNDFNGNRKRMAMEYPTTIEDVLSIGQNDAYWDKEILDKQLPNIEKGVPYKFVTDNMTNKVEAHETDISPFTMFKKPRYGHRYRVVIDPITARSESTDDFAMSVFDLENNEQVAVFSDKGLMDEDYADWAVSIATIYNKAELCPESNVANGFCVAVNARRYYNWYYQNPKERSKPASEREVGIRTTVSTKERMLDALTTMLTRGSIIVHDRKTLDQLRTMVKHIKNRSDGSCSVSVSAKRGKHDDMVMSLVIYAGSLTNHQIEGRKPGGWFII